MNLKKLNQIILSGEHKPFNTQALKSKTPDFELLTKLKILLPVTRDQYAASRNGDDRHGYIECPCKEGHSALVTKKYDKKKKSFEWFAICENGDPMPLTEEELMLWQIDFSKVANFIGMCFKCPLDKLEPSDSGLWFLGQSGIKIARKKWKIFFTLNLNIKTMEEFMSHSQSAILIAAGELPEMSKKIVQQVFSLEDIVLKNDAGYLEVDNQNIAEYLKIVNEKETENKNKEISKKELRVIRLVKLIDRFLFSSCDYYHNHEVEVNGVLKRRIKKYPGREKIAERYKKYYEDDQIWDSTFISKPREMKSVYATLLTALIEGAKDEELVKNYRRWREGKIKRLTRKKNNKDIKLEQMEEVDSYEDDYACIWGDEEYSNDLKAIEAFGIGGENPTGHIISSL